MDNEKEIPFGAFDSELMHQEITIPEGFEATIEGNKIILKKTESDDVKIRKELIKVFSNREKYLIDQSFGDITVPEILAWLEKQVEQKSADKVEPKFHEGEWIIHQGTENIYQVVACIDNQYQLRYGDNYTIQKCADVDRCARLWDITKDAKPGDVLIDKSGSRECPFIFKETKPSDIKTDMLNPLTVLGYCGIGGAGFTKGSGWGDTANCIYYPATKEQRDTLMKAMTDAGYTFNFEKKELKKIDEELTDFEKSLKHIMLETLECGDTRNLKADAELLLRFAQKSIKWNEEDEQIYVSILNDLRQNVIPDEEDIDWLKSLKGRVQPKQEWSEEDKQYFNFLEKLLENLQVESTEDEIKYGINSDSKYYYDIKEWLKSLRPQKQWKPTEEQMYNLSEAAHYHCAFFNRDILISLYDDLAKL